MQGSSVIVAGILKQEEEHGRGIVVASQACLCQMRHRNQMYVDSTGHRFVIIRYLQGPPPPIQ